MRVLIAGGGTGGHLYPGIALAEEITSRPGGEVLFVGTQRGLEAKVVPAAGYPLEVLEVSGIKRTGFRGLVKGLMKLPKAMMASRAILQRYRPEMVVGVGGYASGPMVLMAALMGFPTAIGNPVRRTFVQNATRPWTGEARHLVVVGGSQGARAINDLVTGMAPLLMEKGELPPVLHQSGSNDYDRMRRRYDVLRVGARVDLCPYIEDMPAALARASLVIGRAGALTLAELAIVGCPAILIPLPTASDDHQTRNALAFQDAGAAVVLRQRETSAAGLADVVLTLLKDPPRLAAMAAAMRSLGHSDAARKIVDDLALLADLPSGTRNAS
jgi:UDP-N-acetylglucosamine--N-acetylmuramyl-(pentapeptide) pyrophosphoryl-undecaprenol N-acetylglucosamine transferase